MLLGIICILRGDLLSITVSAMLCISHASIVTLQFDALENIHYDHHYHCGRLLAYFY